MIERLRIVLDTNALLRCLSRRSPYSFVSTEISRKTFDLYVTNEILLEYEEKIAENFSVRLSEVIVSSFVGLTNVKKTSAHFRFNVITFDADDNKFVDCAFACNAHYLVTNDKHYNVLKSLPFPSINVISLEEFAELLQATNSAGA